MSAFVRTTADIKSEGGPWATESVLNAFWSTTENATIELRQTEEGYDPKGAEYTRWIPETFSVWICPIDGEPRMLAAYRDKESAQDHFARARAQIG